MADGSLRPGLRALWNRGDGLRVLPISRAPECPQASPEAAQALQG